MKTEEIVRSLRWCGTGAEEGCDDCAFEPQCDEDAVGCVGGLCDTAADRLDELVDRCARYAEEIAVLRERQRWIPVTERLPEDRSNVLVVAYWHERWGVYMGWCAPERAEWCVHIGIGDRDDVAVTHWMPLPEALEAE